MSTTTGTGICIETVRVANFRCLRRIEVRLGSLAVLIGENNAGKSSFLEALHAAVGSGVRTLSADDIHMDIGEQVWPRDREILIDLRLRPTSPEGSIIDAFPQGSPWLELFGNGVQQDDDDNDFVGIRTQLRWDVIKGDHFVERRFLKNWADDVEDMESSEIAERITQVTAAQVVPLALYLMDAKRDFADDMRSRGSIWQRMVSDPGLSEIDINAIEEKLNEINELIVERSEVLSHTQDHLEQVAGVLRCDASGVAVTPVARRFRDLNKGMDVVISTTGASQFPLAKQGLGTRSLATLFLFRAYMSWRQTQQASEALHPFIGIEEPETHLHPQAQRAVFRQIRSIPGQTIVSTHSPYICAQSPLPSFVHFAKEENHSVVNQLSTSSDAPLSAEETRRIEREVMNTRGELLFSRCLVLFEGETEEQAIPEFAELIWERHPHELGITFVGVGGSGNYLSFLRVAKMFRIPWLVFSDGEENALRAVNSALTQVGEAAAAMNDRVVVLPDGESFEDYICTDNTADVLKGMIIDFVTEAKQLSPQGREALEAEWNSKNEADVIAELKSHKTCYAPRVPHALSQLSDESLHCPQLIRALLDKAWSPPSDTESEASI